MGVRRPPDHVHGGRELAARRRSPSTPDHSTTNMHEAGVDEPDLVKTDGERVYTVSGGTLRVIDTATRKVTASLDCPARTSAATRPPTCWSRASGR